MFKLEGMYVPIPTPFGADLAIDSARLAENVRAWAATSIDGIVVCGSNGELPFTTTDERAELTRAVRRTLDECRSDKRVVTGTFRHTTADAIECARRAADAGADAALLLPPHYYKGGGMPAARRFYEDVADASPIPIIIYNMPANTGVSLDAETIIALSRHENICGIKDTSGDMNQMGYVCRAQGESFRALGGTASWLLAALALGASGGTMGVANVFPEACRALMDLFYAGKLAEAAELQGRVLLASDAVTRRFGVPALKATLDACGLYGGPCRPPLMPLSPETRRKLIDAITEADLDRFEKWRPPIDWSRAAV